MPPDGRSSLGTHYASVDDWQNEAKDNPTNSRNNESSQVFPPRTPRRCGTRNRELRSGRPGSGPGLTRNCCRTTNDIPYGAHFPIGETLDSVGEWKPAGKPVRHLEYGYEATWRPSRAVVSIKDIMEPCAVTPLDTGFRPSIKVINSGTGAWSEKWKPSKRYIDPGRSKDYEWRPSVRTSYPYRKGHEEDYRPQVRPDPVNSGLETNQGNFRPIRRYIVPHTPLKQPAAYQHKRHIVVPAEWVPPFKIQGEDYNTAPPKRMGRARVNEYSESHPPLCLAWNAADQPGSVPCDTYRPGSSSVFVGRGATPFICGPDGQPRLSKKYSSFGHSTNFEDKSCCICKIGTGNIERKPLRNRSTLGPYYDSVPDRNPISGNMPETDLYCPTRINVGPALYGPAGSINADIIHHKFSDLLQRSTPVSEMKDSYGWKGTER